ncbi:hypothetical protein ACFQFC_20440 [Amorphoplanes digitatis]|uniref:DUF3558 domain-containing protein n=1 Tax=Actinoplanes digitatis TaxID=1868 RepID=A0A7W7I517_9ACTN|nr:hypothetical protein [Actinoplanes digitatis]MBB4766586.1 hypothetical protein [Actinoplanes digitatis]
MAVVGFAAGLWSWKPWTGGDPWVPTCSDLTVAMPSVAAGAWSVSEEDPGRTATDSAAQCELAYASTDQRFAGRLRVFISGESDAEVLRQRVADEQCDGTADPGGVPDGYVAFRACSAVVGDFAHGTVIAAKDGRWLKMTASTSIRDENRDDALPFSRDIARKAAEQALTLDETK